MNVKQISLLVILSSLILSAYLWIPADQFSLAAIQQQYQEFYSQVQDNFWLSALLFSLSYILITSLSLPLATVLTLLGGALFGLLTATVLVLFSASCGATLAFWSARFIFRDSLEQRFAQRLEDINQGIQEQGSFYLFSLRLLPLIPFFMVNILMGLTRMNSRVFFGVSFLGMLPATLIYVNAGTQLAQIRQLSDIVSPTMLLALVLLATMPWLIGFVLKKLNRQTKSS